MKIHFMGGTEGIGASCVLVEVNDLNNRPFRIMLDCGLHPGESGENRLPAFNPFYAETVPDVLLLSHAHLDHTGAVPCIMQIVPGLKIYCTKPTRDIMHALLVDSARIMKGDTGSVPLYSEAEAHTVCDNVKVIDFMKPARLAPGIYTRFIPAGHIIGASGIMLETPEKRVLYIGDYSTQPSRTVGAQQFGRLFRKPEIIITEATYGDRIHPDRALEEDRLKQDITDTIDKGGRVLIPTFSVGRAQELLLMLQDMRLQVPVYIDGMIQSINLIYEANTEFLKSNIRYSKNDSIFNQKGFYQVCSREFRAGILDNTDPCVILSSGGMLSGGASVHYAGNILEDDKNLLALVGHQDPETPGGKLLDSINDYTYDNHNAGQGWLLEIAGQAFSVNCRVEKYSFSAHADMNGIISVLKSLKPENILLVHGETPALESIRSRLQSEGMHAEIPSRGQVFYYKSALEYKQCYEH